MNLIISKIEETNCIHWLPSVEKLAYFEIKMSTKHEFPAQAAEAEIARDTPKNQSVSSNINPNHGIDEDAGLENLAGTSPSFRANYRKYGTKRRAIYFGDEYQWLKDRLKYIGK